jgi:adenylosuccinate synthase
MNKADVIIGLQHGDEAKAKCAYSICQQNKNYYNYVVRYNGGPNAGHTIYHEGRKFVTHQIPVGVFFDIHSIIGPCSVVDIEKLTKESD